MKKLGALLDRILDISGEFVCALIAFAFVIVILSVLFRYFLHIPMVLL